MNEALEINAVTLHKLIKMLPPEDVYHAKGGPTKYSECDYFWMGSVAYCITYCYISNTVILINTLLMNSNYIVNYKH